MSKEQSAIKSEFDKNCERYRQMMKEIENEPFEKRRDRINAFRAGIV